MNKTIRLSSGVLYGGQSNNQQEGAMMQWVMVSVDSPGPSGTKPGPPGFVLCLRNQALLGWGAIVHSISVLPTFNFERLSVWTGVNRECALPPGKFHYDVTGLPTYCTLGSIPLRLQSSAAKINDWISRFVIYFVIICLHSCDIDIMGDSSDLPVLLLMRITPEPLFRLQMSV